MNPDSFESGSTRVRPGYVHTRGKVVVVKICIPEVTMA